VTAGTDIVIKANFSPSLGRKTNWKVTQGADIASFSSYNDSTQIARFNTYSPGEVKITAISRHNFIVKWTQTKEITVTVTAGVTPPSFDQIDSLFYKIVNGVVVDQRPSTSYFHPLAAYAAELSSGAYKQVHNATGNQPQHIEEMLGKPGAGNNIYGYEDYEDYNYGDAGAHAFAHREIGGPGGRSLIVVAVRGTNGSADQRVNFLEGPFNLYENESLGYHRLAVDVRNNLIGSNGYISRHGLSNKNPIVLITGHSLGGATANILAHSLMTNYNWATEDIYCYTFGAPGVVGCGIPGSEDNIFNILNKNDWLPFWPSLIKPGDPWCYDRHGQTLGVAMKKVTTGFEMFDFLPIIDNHLMPTFVSFFLNDERLTDSMTWEQLKAIGDKDCWGPWAILVGILCPVDVYILNDTHEILAFETERELDSGNIGMGFAENSDVISWITEDGAKMFFIPPGSDASYIYIVAYEDEEQEPEMTVKITAIDPASDEHYDDTIFEEVGLEDGKEFLISLTEGSEDAPIQVSDIQLQVIEYNQVLEKFSVLGEVAKDGKETMF